MPALVTLVIALLFKPIFGQSVVATHGNPWYQSGNLTSASICHICKTWGPEGVHDHTPVICPETCGQMVANEFNACSKHRWARLGEQFKSELGNEQKSDKAQTAKKDTTISPTSRRQSSEVSTSTIQKTLFQDDRDPYLTHVIYPCLTLFTTFITSGLDPPKSDWCKHRCERLQEDSNRQECRVECLDEMFDIRKGDLSTNEQDLVHHRRHHRAHPRVKVPPNHSRNAPLYRPTMPDIDICRSACPLNNECPRLCDSILNDLNVRGEWCYLKCGEQSPMVEFMWPTTGRSEVREEMVLEEVNGDGSSRETGKKSFTNIDKRQPEHPIEPDDLSPKMIPSNRSRHHRTLSHHIRKSQTSADLIHHKHHPKSPWPRPRSGKDYPNPKLYARKTSKCVASCWERYFGFEYMSDSK